MSLLNSIGFSLWTMYGFRASRASPARVRSMQQQRLRKLLRHAAGRSSFYRRKFRGIDLEHCALADLPTTTKTELMDQFDDVVTDPHVSRAGVERFVDEPSNVGQLFLDRYPVCHTSGSQGQSLLVVQDRLTIDLMFAMQMTRGNVGYGGPWEALRRIVSPARLAIIISKPGFFPSAWVWQHLPRALSRYVKMLYIPSSDPQLDERLNAFNPTALTGNPSVLELLSVDEGRFHFPALRQVTATSETLTDRARERIARAFGAPVLNNYACGECMFLANGCREGRGTHINADWAILEVVDADNRPVHDGQPGQKILLTNLANTVQPFIRYEVGDRLTMATAPCGCGNRLPRIERIDGRASELFWVRARTGLRPLLMYPFQHAFEYLREVREWQAIQHDRNRIELRIEMLPGATLDMEAARTRLDQRLATVGLNGELDIELKVVPRLDWDPRTGKFRRLVSHIGPPAEKLGAPVIAKAS